MKYWQFLLFVGLSLQCDTAHAETGLAQSAPVKQHLMGLSAAEAGMLLIKLKEAQSSLKTGDMQYFDLLAGSVASFEATKISPERRFWRSLLMKYGESGAFVPIIGCGSHISFPMLPKA